MNVGQDMTGTELTADCYTVGPASYCKNPFDCLKLSFTAGEQRTGEVTLLSFTADHAKQIVAAIGAQYPGVIAAVAREMNLGPTLEPTCGGDDARCDLHCADPEATSCECCRREVRDGE